MISYSLPASKRRRQPLVIALLLLIAIWTWHSTRASKATHDEGFYPERYPLAWKYVSLASTPSGGTFSIAILHLRRSPVVHVLEMATISLFQTLITCAQLGISPLSG